MFQLVALMGGAAHLGVQAKALRVDAALFCGQWANSYARRGSLRRVRASGLKSSPRGRGLERRDQVPLRDGGPSTGGSPARAVTAGRRERKGEHAVITDGDGWDHGRQTGLGISGA